MADQISQSKLFIDVGGTGGSSRELKQIQTFDVKDGNEASVTVAIGGHKGFRHKVGGFEIEMKGYREAGKRPEVDWLGLKAVKRVFTITEQDENGGRRRAFTCKVSKVDSSSNNEGVYEDTIMLVATFDFPGVPSFFA